MTGRRRLMITPRETGKRVMESETNATRSFAGVDTGVKVGSRSRVRGWMGWRIKDADESGSVSVA